MSGKRHWRQLRFLAAAVFSQRTTSASLAGSEPGNGRSRGKAARRRTRACPTLAQKMCRDQQQPISLRGCCARHSFSRGGSCAQSELAAQRRLRQSRRLPTPAPSRDALLLQTAELEKTRVADTHGCSATGSAFDPRRRSLSQGVAAQLVLPAELPARPFLLKIRR